MPNTKSAKKALRVSKRKTEYNKVKKNRLKDSLKAFRKSLSTTLEDSQKALSKAFSDLDKAAKRNTINHKTADRKKSRLTAVLKKTFGQFEGADTNKDAAKSTKAKTAKAAPKKTETAAKAKKAPAKKPAAKKTTAKKATTKKTEDK